MDVATPCHLLQMDDHIEIVTGILKCILAPTLVDVSSWHGGTVGKTLHCGSTTSGMEC